MRYFNSISNHVKPIMSGHDTFALRYGWSKKVYDRIEEQPYDVNIFSENYAISALGVGKNMLNAMRHWAIHLGLIWRDNANHNYHNTDGEANEKTHRELGISPNNDFYHAKQFFDDAQGIASA